MSNFDNTPPVVAPLYLGAWSPVRVALTSGVTNPVTIANGSVVDGVALATGDRFVCVGARTDAGIYTVGASSSARASDANEPLEFFAGRRVQVLLGNSFNVGVWILLTEGLVDLGVTTLTISYLSAEAIDMPSTGFTGSPATPTSTARSTTIYYGSSANATLTEGQAKSDLFNTIRSSVVGNYACPASAYKYLAVPASMDAPSGIRDFSSGMAVMLAGSGDGYGNATNNLQHASLTIDGVVYRVYRSANQLGAALTLQVL